MSLPDDLLATLPAFDQGANFRQVHWQGVRVVTIQRDEHLKEFQKIADNSYHTYNGDFKQ